MQSVDAGRGLVLSTSPGSARVEGPDGASTRLPLRSGDRVSDFKETADGWVATGIRVDKDHQELLVLRENTAGMDRLPSPVRASTERLLARPVVLAEGGGMGGVAWLEGDGPRSMAVRFADWHDGVWGPAETVSPPGDGSQTGLSGTVLADGSWLLVWSAFDGTDDEIFWSRREGEGWSTPSRLHAGNSVPDITPVVVAADGGALLAWSRYDGNDYRLMIARFEGGAWTQGRMAGPPGSLFPSFTRQDGRTFVVYRNAVPAGWSAAEVDDSGRLQRTAMAAEPSTARPVLRVTEGQGAVMSWPSLNRDLAVSWDALP